MRKKINCKVIQSRRLDLSGASSCVGDESGNANAQAFGMHAGRYAAACTESVGCAGSRVDSYA
ncbi:MAG: hypothetical protein GY809_10130 [Planctomycetes bacterium]|nr:hypothetical protein [Planctomycetota bacterium]